MDRFNQWEKEENRRLSDAERIRRFLLLYDLFQYIPEERKDMLHQRHLEALIQTQKQLKVAFESH